MLDIIMFKQIGHRASSIENRRLSLGKHVLGHVFNGQILTLWFLDEIKWPYCNPLSLGRKRMELMNKHWLASDYHTEEPNKLGSSLEPFEA